ncbi:MAG: hypothetical protein JEZ10_07950 [Verrucomicrobia bacterium]|nr:hypothetical protein [Verrucomicrobiota bacterium]
MKIYLLLAVLFTGHLMASGELSEQELKRLKDVEISGTRTDTWKSDDREKFETLEINTCQNMNDPVELDMTRFRMRLVVELTDKEKNTYLVKFTGNALGNYESGYQGEDYWELYMAHGDLERLDVSGYIIQYGIMDGGTFVPLAEKQDGSTEMMDRMRKKTTRLFPGKVYLRHSYQYEDTTARMMISDQRNIRAIKE